MMTVRASILHKFWNGAFIFLIALQLVMSASNQRFRKAEMNVTEPPSIAPIPTPIDTSDSSLSLKFCQEHDELSTDLFAETGSYGNMFDMKTNKTAVTIDQMEFFTDRESDLKFHVWTKSGTHKGSEKCLDCWTKIAEGTTKGRGDKETTPIPKENFTPIRVDSDTIQSFVVVLETPDIRYGSGENTTKEGEVDSKNDHISIYAGVSVSQFPAFHEQGSYFSPRIWKGAIHYTTDVICPEPTPLPTSPPLEPISTDVFFRFVIEHDPAVLGVVLSDISEIVTNFITEVIADGDKLVLSELTLDGGIRLENVKSDKYESVFEDKCTSSGTDEVCSGIESVATFSHSPHFTSTQVRYAFYLYAPDILNHILNYSAFYTGPRATNTDVILKIDGVELEAFTNEESSEYFENTVLEFLSDSLDGQINLADVSIKESVLLPHHEHRQIEEDLRLKYSTETSRERLHYTSSVNVSIAVTGEYQPPPDVNLRELVSDSFEDDAEILVENLKTGGNEEFEDVEGIKCYPVVLKGDVIPFNETLVGDELYEPGSKSKNTIYIIIGGCVGLVLLVSAVVGGVILSKKKKRYQHVEKNEDKYEEKFVENTIQSSNSLDDDDYLFK